MERDPGLKRVIIDSGRRLTPAATLTAAMLAIASTVAGCGTSLTYGWPGSAEQTKSKCTIIQGIEQKPDGSIVRSPTTSPGFCIQTFEYKGVASSSPPDFQTGGSFGDIPKGK